MPSGQGSQLAKSAKKIKTNVSVWTRSKAASIKQADSNTTENDPTQEGEETAYERILNKVKEKRRREGHSPPELDSGLTKKQKPVEVSTRSRPGRVTATFIEDDNYVTMDVTNESMRKEFPNEEEDGNLSLDMSQEESINNNATVQDRATLNVARTERSPSVSHGNVNTDGLPICASSGPAAQHESTDKEQTGLKKMLNLVQKYMVKKGLIDSSLSEQEMLEFMEVSDKEQEPLVEDPILTASTSGYRRAQSPVKNPVHPKAKQVNKGNCNYYDNPSEITIYQRAVKQVNPHIDEQIDSLLRQTRLDGGANNSSSSEELMDTSDEATNNQIDLNMSQGLNIPLVPGTVAEVNPGPTADKPKTAEEIAKEQSAKLVVEAEQQKGNMYEVPGNILNFPSESIGLTVTASVSQIDQDYQMIDSHIEEPLRRKVQSFDYIDLAKLLPRNKGSRDEDGQRLEIVNKNGVSYLSLVEDKEGVSISSYFKWEQAFRIYSNLITSKYPSKATELLQYNHTIQTAAMSYQWDNVYAYDHEFRQHIGRHPSRTWSVILQQAWTMLLKDRIKQHDGPHRRTGGKGEPCRRFNRGKCAFGLSCKYDHRCAVKKCGKFGHGAHMCRLRKGAHMENSSDNEVKN